MILGFYMKYVDMSHACFQGVLYDFGIKDDVTNDVPLCELNRRSS